MSDQTTPEERAARRDSEALCGKLRARGDAESLDAAAMIEGTLEAFAGIALEVAAQRQRAEAVERNHAALLRLWQGVPQSVRVAVAHGLGRAAA